MKPAEEQYRGYPIRVVGPDRFRCAILLFDACLGFNSTAGAMGWAKRRIDVELLGGVAELAGPQTDRGGSLASLKPRAWSPAGKGARSS